jgi:hypothetical protein
MLKTRENKLVRVDLPVFSTLVHVELASTVRTLCECVHTRSRPVFLTTPDPTPCPGEGGGPRG